MSEAQQLFYELFFGVGQWLGAILLLGFVVIFAYAKKALCICMIVVSLMISIWYFENVAGNQNLMWAAVLFLVLPLFLAYHAATTKGD